MFGRFDLIKKTGRSEKTPVSEIEIFKPWLYPEDYHGAILTDWADLLKAGAGTQSGFVRSVSKSAGRRWDNLILRGFFANLWHGQKGLEQMPFDFTNNTVSVGVGASSATGLNTRKIEMGLKKLKQQSLFLGYEEVFMVLDSTGNDQLIRDIKAVHKDFEKLGGKIEKGMLLEYQGVKFKHIEFLNPVEYPDAEDLFDADTNVALYPMYVKSRMHLGAWKSFSMKAAERPDLSHAQQIYAYMSANATRLEKSTGVLAIESDVTK
jgi:hypothetical protein